MDFAVDSVPSTRIKSDRLLARNWIGLYTGHDKQRPFMF